MERLPWRGRLASEPVRVRQRRSKQRQQPCRIVQIYQEAVPEITQLNRELSAATVALVAEALWQKNDAEGAIRQLSQAESSAPGSLYVYQVSERVRSSIAEALVLKASTVARNDTRKAD